MTGATTTKTTATNTITTECTTICTKTINRRKHNQRQHQELQQQQRFPHQQLFSLLTVIILALQVTITPTDAAVHPVFTYKNASTALGQLVTSSTLMWETYDPKDPKQLQYAVEGGKYLTEDEHYPIYVCRVTIDGVPTSGHTEKIAQSHVCVAAHYKHDKFNSFDVLVNKGHLSKVGWRHWRKFNAHIPVGAIRIVEDAYIARHRATHHSGEQSDRRGADYNLGRLEQSLGLGKIKVVENEKERDYDEGEVLVETEPFRYELRDIKLDNIRLDMRENITELASGVLVNRGEKYSLVETVLSYQYDYVQYWGTHEGAARGLPTKIYEKDAETPAEINWGLKYNEKRYETKTVHTKLWPGTALNVTLKGNYVTLEAPYKAKLFAFYYGSESSVSREIRAEVRKSYLKDVKLEFSPVYWIENGTFVPTTTTSTTSTTSTTTHPTTTTTHDPKPIHEPPQVHVKDVGRTLTGQDPLEKKMHHDSPDSNEVANDVPENYAEKHQNHALAGVAAPSNSGAMGVYAATALLLIVAMALRI